MKKYNFDEIIIRENTNCVKYDLRKVLFRADDIIPLWVADMDFKTPDFIVEAIRERTNHEIFGYSIRPDSFYESIMNWVKKRHNWEIKKNWITISPGVVPALALCVHTFTKPGDKIIVQPPVYFPFFSTVKNNGRQLVYNQLKFENNQYAIDFENLEKQIDSRTKMLFLSNPHNPVGRVWIKDELLKLNEICEKHKILVLSDEVHSDLIFKPHKHIPFATVSEYAKNNSITTIAPSKTFNVAGLSTSALIIPNDKFHQEYVDTLDNFHISNGNLFGNIGLEAAYTYGENWLEQLLDYLKENYNYLVDFINKYLPEIKVISIEGTYLVWLNFKDLGLPQNELNELLVKKAKIGLNDGEMFGQGGEGFQRMNIACPQSVLKMALERLHNALK